MGSADAQSRVLSTPELFSNILQQLRPGDLLLLQRVNKEWKTVIDTDPLLQQALFLQPQPILTESNLDTEGSRVELNPLLLKAFPDWLTSTSPTFGSIRFSESPWIKDDTSKLIFLRREASWRRMLVCQPPVQALEVRHYHIPFGKPSLIKGMITCQENDGVRMGLLYDLAEWKVHRRGLSFVEFTAKTIRLGALTEFSLQWRQDRKEEDANPATASSELLPTTDFGMVKWDGRRSDGPRKKSPIVRMTLKTMHQCTGRSTKATSKEFFERYMSAGFEEPDIEPET